ncbi:hypothetical protein BJ508DRAFT_333851 [Ascobolus immersus RN42]|uniref:Uncharacterized protein n=1 Tax=Ascobolus immersus RN42 TaxID=1160509 RepID=A0A3N4HKB0_ASCIM|nr:hypothetical protein BJ508DRAFT_333851 [Ascobolus immersus RN42]
MLSFRNPTQGPFELPPPAKEFPQTVEPGTLDDRENWLESLEKDLQTRKADLTFREMFFEASNEASLSKYMKAKQYASIAPNQPVAQTPEEPIQRQIKRLRHKEMLLSLRYAVIAAHYQRVLGDFERFFPRIVREMELLTPGLFQRSLFKPRPAFKDIVTAENLVQREEKANVIWGSIEFMRRRTLQIETAMEFFAGQHSGNRNAL